MQQSLKDMILKKTQHMKNSLQVCKNIFKMILPIVSLKEKFDLFEYDNLNKVKIEYNGYKNLEERLFTIVIEYDKERYKFIKDQFDENLVCYFKTNNRLKTTRQIEFKKIIKVKDLEIKTTNIRGSVTLNSFENILRIEFYTIYYQKFLHSIKHIYKDGDLILQKKEYHTRNNILI